MGEIGARAKAEADGWKLIAQNNGSGRHDLIFYRDGRWKVVEAKGGGPGDKRLGDSVVGPPEARVRVTQGTDEYLWDKLANDKELMSNNPDLARVVAEQDRSKVDYSLIKTDTKGRVTEYGFRTELGPAHPDYIPKGPEIDSALRVRPVSSGLSPAIGFLADGLSGIESLRVETSQHSQMSGERLRRLVDQSLTVQISEVRHNGNRDRKQNNFWLTFAAHLR